MRRVRGAVCCAERVSGELYLWLALRRTGRLTRLPVAFPCVCPRLPLPAQYSPKNHVIYSNRSMCYGRLGKYAVRLYDSTARALLLLLLLLHHHAPPDSALCAMRKTGCAGGCKDGGCHDAHVGKGLRPPGCCS